MCVLVRVWELGEDADGVGIDLLEAGEDESGVVVEDVVEVRVSLCAGDHV